ncbi:hypothetical protein EGH82_23490 [Vibrio ponticus]|uniref:O-antigen ligase-related domain-containing protein n=1 Tax=Vibrio ponticus TaxID=265668 RepID=A0A3N3DPS9_9VIBR|nr:O-antigen ligase family protein [Vibrio ponticus]ROV56471.1 hypothetical protein EGH82_23490 [Vibrio ponticus]
MITKLLVFLISFLYPFDLFAFINVSGYGVTYQIFTIMISLVYVLFISCYKGRVSNFSKNIVIFFMLTMSIYVILIPMSIGGTEYVYNAFLSSMFFCVFISVIVILSEVGNIKTITNGYYYSCLLVFLYAIYQYFARKYGLLFDYLPITNETYLINDLNRSLQPQYSNASSFFLEPSYLGRFSVIAVFISGYIFTGFKKITIISLAILSLCTSFSFGSFLVMFLVYFSSVIIKSEWGKLKSLPLILACGVFMIMINEDFSLRVTSFVFNVFSPDSVQGSYSIRLEGMIQAIEAFYSYPLFGSGFSIYKLMTGTMGTDSQVFEIVYQFGIVGMLLYLFLLYRIAKINDFGLMISLLIFYYMGVYNGAFDLLNALLFVFSIFIYREERHKKLTSVNKQELLRS